MLQGRDIFWGWDGVMQEVGRRVIKKNINQKGWGKRDGLPWKALWATPPRGSDGELTTGGHSWCWPLPSPLLPSDPWRREWRPRNIRSGRKPAET